MEFYGLVRDGPKNLFSRRAAKKATQEAATSEQKKNTKKRQKKQWGKVYKSHPITRGRGGRQGRILVLASGTGHTQSRRRRAQWGWGKTHRKFHSRRWRRASVFHRFRVGLSRDFIWIFAVLKDSPHTHTHWKRYAGSFFCFSFSQCLGLGISRLSFLFAVLRRARRFVYAFVNVVTEIFTSGALGVITIMKSYYEPWG